MNKNMFVYGYVQRPDIDPDFSSDKTHVIKENMSANSRWSNYNTDWIVVLNLSLNQRIYIHDHDDSVTEIVS